MKIVGRFRLAFSALMVVAGCGLEEDPGGRGGSQPSGNGQAGSAQATGTTGMPAGGAQTTGTGGSSAAGGASAGGGASGGASDAAVGTRDADASTGRVDARVDTGTRG